MSNQLSSNSSPNQQPSDQACPSCWKTPYEQQNKYAFENTRKYATLKGELNEKKRVGLENLFPGHYRELAVQEAMGATGRFSHRSGTWDFGPIVLTTTYSEPSILPSWLTSRISPNMYTVYNKRTGSLSKHIFDHPHDCYNNAEKMYEKLRNAKILDICINVNGSVCMNDIAYPVQPKKD